ncbi:MAG: hypothetical protein JXA92_06975 [candidate division Zixibacteria bacterium]|nr:hypothetical protein [candidate division Zixibacteria bacterium]
MKKKVFLTFVIVLLFAAQALFAQGNQQQNIRNYVRSELERTDQMLQRAGDAIRGGNNPMAVTNYDRAKEIQEMAWNRFREETLESYQAALKLTRLARQQAGKALSNSRQTEQYEGVILQKLERAGDLLERAKEAVELGDDANLRAIYDLAGDNLTKAWEFYRNGDYKPALKLVNQVVKTAEKILNAFNDQLRKEGFYERHRENIARMLQNARQAVNQCGSEDGQAFMVQAENAFKRAEELSDEKHFRAALKQLQTARVMAVKAARECQGLDFLTNRYEHIKSEADRIAEQIAGLPLEQTEAARELLEQLNQQLELSLSYIEQEQIEPAIASLKAAQLILSQLKKMVNNL